MGNLTQWLTDSFSPYLSLSAAERSLSITASSSARRPRRTLVVALKYTNPPPKHLQAHPPRAHALISMSSPERELIAAADIQEAAQQQNQEQQAQQEQRLGTKRPLPDART